MSNNENNHSNYDNSNIGNNCSKDVLPLFSKDISIGVGDDEAKEEKYYPSNTNTDNNCCKLDQSGRPQQDKLEPRQSRSDGKEEEVDVFLSPNIYEKLTAAFKGGN